MMKQTTLLFGAFASALFFFSASAADTEAAPTPPENRQRDDEQSGGRRSGRPGGWNREGRRGGMMGAPVNPRAEAEAKIKEKFPEEFAAIEKMRAEAEAKLQELAKKAGVEIPKTMSEQLAELKAKYPKEMAEIEELGKTDRRAAFQKIRELAEKAAVPACRGAETVPMTRRRLRRAKIRCGSCGFSGRNSRRRWPRSTASAAAILPPRGRKRGNF